MWHILLKPGSELCTVSKEALLTKVVGRLYRHARLLSQTHNKGNKPNAIVKASVLEMSMPSDAPIRGDHGITGLVNAFRAAIFSPFSSWRNEAYPFASELYKWALSEALAAFAPQRSLINRWKSLALLAHCDPAGSTAPSSVRQLRCDYDRRGILDWDVICILAAMQKSCIHFRFGSPLDPALEHDIQCMGTTLWTIWLWNCRSKARPRFVAQAVAASFFRLAAIAKDVDLADAVTHHCTSSKLWDIEANDVTEVMQVALLATERIEASLICGTNSLAHVLAELHVSVDSCLWPAVIQRIISNFGKRDVQRATKLYFLANQITQIPMDISLPLAVLLSSRGSIDVTLHLLRNLPISEHQTQTLVDAALLFLAKHRDITIHPDIANVLGDVMYTLYKNSPPSPDYRPVIQRMLLALVSSNRSARAGAIFHMIYIASPSFFAKAFTLRLLRLLIRHRQFRLVTQIIKSLPHSKPRAMHLQGLGLLGLSRGGANTLAMRANIIGETHGALARMAYAVKFRAKSPPRVLSLKISSTMEEYTLDGPAAQFATSILVRAGRISAAKRMLRRTLGHLDPQVRTSLGNVILDGYIMRLSTRNGRHMRKVLAAYDSLIRECDFLPDRVTVNTLLKAILRWRNMVDSGRLRALFDHLVRNGYPGGGYSDCGLVPFGTPLSFGLAFLLPRFDQPMSFNRHIRPMLKMFIKAFHVRGDAAAARRVVGILKLEESKDMGERPVKRI